MTDQEGISAGRSFPQWLKAKPFEVDTHVVSPPPHDDSFFYIRYPSDKSSDRKQPINGIGSISEAITKLDTKLAATTLNGDQKCLMQHTEPCKQYLNNKDRELTIANVKHPPKPFGTDDGFKGAGAACGSSIVKVAQQMVSAKSLTRGFTHSNFSKDTEEVIAEHKLVDDSINRNNSSNNIILPSEIINDQQPPSPSRLRTRRGSKSLPASPLSSPKAMRKNQNPYFTGPFAVASPNINQVATAEHPSRSWFLSSLLGVQREASSTQSVASIISEDGEDSVPMKPKITKFPKAKPSDLREMNFWTPTSL